MTALSKDEALQVIELQPKTVLALDEYKNTKPLFMALGMTMSVTALFATAYVTVVGLAIVLFGMDWSDIWRAILLATVGFAFSRLVAEAVSERDRLAKARHLVGLVNPTSGELTPDGQAVLNRFEPLLKKLHAQGVAPGNTEDLDARLTALAIEERGKLPPAPIQPAIGATPGGPAVGAAAEPAEARVDAGPRDDQDEACA